MVRTIGVISALLLLAGCGDLPSIEGVATKENTVFDQALVGAWNAGDAVIIVQPGEDRSYRVHWVGAESNTDTPRFVRMEARLAKIGEQRILDLTTSEEGAGAFTIPCHVFLRVRPVKDGLKVQFVDSKWIRGQVNIPNFVHDGHPVLTAPASQVEGFLLKFGFDERALDDPMILHPLKQKP